MPPNIAKTIIAIVLYCNCTFDALECYAEQYLLEKELLEF